MSAPVTPGQPGPNFRGCTHQVQLPPMEQRHCRQWMGAIAMVDEGLVMPAHVGQHRLGIIMSQPMPLVRTSEPPLLQVMAYPRIFMDETRYRSSRMHYGFNVIPLGQHVTSSCGVDNGVGSAYYYHTTYSAPRYYLDAADQINQIYMQQSGVRWYTDAQIQRANLNAAIANGAIFCLPQPVLFVQPMRCSSGAYPPGFASRRHVSDFLHMGDDQLQQILMAYGLLPGRPQYTFALRNRPLIADAHHRLQQQEYGLTGPVTRRLANLIALFDYLGAHRVADRLRLRAD
ncbi:hypothetical protein CERZMDRAFT_101764 [Cercospora zeae-maydis SCOH1-5]|uniref:Uncharacterized protein n=1 Tax=Cercospora zeae-maydis SCOH1-5 TaxID=717836 RepID=A0A6A6F6U7_9PEZI|nr:hypothetical protein CERZMDRAFT_101764 [Cercospora zeae-maydis SCOH1-5]